MSKIALSGNASGTGTFTIASPDSNSDRTLNLPDNSGTVLTTAGGTLTGALALPAGGLNVGSGQLAVDASGRVTMSSQPMLACWLANTNGTGLGGLFALGQASPNINVGSHFNTTTRVFTCPVAGYYRVSVSASSGDGAQHYIGIAKNGTAITDALLFYTNFTTAACSLIVSCGANDTLGAYSRYNTGLYGAQLSIELIG
jgi:hypothetical protein